MEYFPYSLHVRYSFYVVSVCNRNCRYQTPALYVLHMVLHVIQKRGDTHVGGVIWVLPGP